MTRFWEANDRILSPLFRWFRLAAIGLAIEVIILLISVGGHVFWS